MYEPKGLEGKVAIAFYDAIITQQSCMWFLCAEGIIGINEQQTKYR